MQLGLNQVEIDAIQNAPDLMINMWNRELINGPEGINITWSTDRKRWPAQIVCELSQKNHWWFDTLKRVAVSLGYNTYEEYNATCIRNPREILDRIYELKCQ